MGGNQIDLPSGWLCHLGEFGLGVMGFQSPKKLFIPHNVMFGSNFAL